MTRICAEEMRVSFDCMHFAFFLFLGLQYIEKTLRLIPLKKTRDR